MPSRFSFVVGLAGATAAAVAACSDGGETTLGAGAGALGGHATSSHGASGPGGTGGTSGTTVTGPCNVGPDIDGDGDGWTPAEGDCDDCNPASNPGAVDVLVPVEDGDPVAVDLDCDGEAAPPEPCDDGLALDDQDAMSAARALDLCQTTEAAPATKQERRWGVLDARWVSASGVESRKPAAQAGILDAFGKGARVQAGARMLAISTGRARTPDQPDACKASSCAVTSNIDPPDGFPQVVPSCEGGTIINDDVALEVALRAPTNALGFSFGLKFHSFEYPEWVCTNFNDQFVTLVSPPPSGSIHGNVAFDAMLNPVSVNLSFFDVCNPASMPYFAAQCSSANCPGAPIPYCAEGPAELDGTGFDIWGEAGATRWLTTRAPVKGGSDITVRFAIWDTTDQAYDSTVLLDGFSWVTSGPSSVSTEPRPNPH